MKILFSLALYALIPLTAYSASVAIIDSGVDFEHQDLRNQLKKNRAEATGEQEKDDDQNGFIDDIEGWNIVENSPKVFQRELMEHVTDEVYHLYEVRAKFIEGSASNDEKKWFQEKLTDVEFLKVVNFFGAYAHGSHVAGIAKGPRDSHQLYALKFLSTNLDSIALIKKALAEAPKEDETPTPGEGDGDDEEEKERDPLAEVEQVKRIVDFLVMRSLPGNVLTYNYINSRPVDVANGSFGFSYFRAYSFAGSLFNQIINKKPEPGQLGAIATYFINQNLSTYVPLANGNQKTLFVFAAGNDGVNNDIFPQSPANLEAENSITVAATAGRKALANFSNYGMSKVHVAAPGVNISSTVPGGRYLPLSGTSMAAPYVTYVAATVADTNTNLRPSDIKKILIETVDKKDFLAGKVMSGGIVNVRRASRAGELSKDMVLEKAIAMANEEVQDIPDEKGMMNLAELTPNDPLLFQPSQF